jgi:mycoredoxin-dependent peroxiredoxin
MSPAIGCGAVTAALAVSDEGAELHPARTTAPAPASASVVARRLVARNNIDFMIPSSPRTLPPMTAIELHAVPAVGEVAPDFTLPSTSDQKVTLSALRGKPVLLAFFPLAFSSTCTSELCEMRDDHQQFSDRGVAVVPISVDHTYSLKEYKAKYAMKVDLLSDFRRDVSRAYGVLLEDKFFSTRAYFLIDAAGVIRWEHVEANPSNRRDDAEILAAIDRLG